MRHTCGTSRCRCARGEKHESWYPAYSRGGRKQMEARRKLYTVLSLRRQCFRELGAQLSWSGWVGGGYPSGS